MNNFNQKIKNLSLEELHSLAHDIRSEYKIGLISAKDASDKIDLIQIEVFERELGGNLYEK